MECGLNVASSIYTRISAAAAEQCLSDDTILEDARVIGVYTYRRVHGSFTYMYTYIYNAHSGQAQRLESETRAVAIWQKGHVNTQ